MKEQEDRSESTINQQPDKLTPRHRALMRLLVSGKELKDAAPSLGFSVVRASVVVNSPLFQEEMKQMETDVNSTFTEAEGLKNIDATDDTRVELMDAKVKAAKTLSGALDDGDKKIALSAAKDILDRTGYAKEDKLKGKILVGPSQSLLDVIARIYKDKNAGTDDKS